MIERTRPWEPIDEEWNSIVRNFQDAIGKSIAIGADLIRIRAIMELCAGDMMDWDNAWVVEEGPDNIPNARPRLQVVKLPGTQLRLPLDLPCEPVEPMARRPKPSPVDGESPRRDGATAILRQAAFNFQEAS